MATLLVNHKMNPALAARVHASVTGQRGKLSAPHSTARWMSRVRFGVVAGLVVLVVSIGVSLRREKAELEQARAALLLQWSAQADSLSTQDQSFTERAEKSLNGLTGPFTSDLVADELKTPGAFAKALTRPAVYVRGALSALEGSSAAVARAASDSGKDTLLLCLMDPPPARDEKTLLAKARLALSGGNAFLQATHSALRLFDAEVGLPILLPPWSERIKTAKSTPDLQRIERELKRAPLASAKRALRAELLIAVLDEPSDKGTVTELDGEAPHYIRLNVIELYSAKALLKMRKRVDPGWVTPNRRSQYARELDGCRFALDVLATVRGE